jgi:hypothetical protein
MDSIGLPESKLMGGTLYNEYNGINVWTNLINGQYGIMFPNKFWQPDYMMGGGTPMHVADLKYYGFWNPQDTAHYLTHDTSNHMRHIGVGCEIKIKNDSVPASDIIAKINEVVNLVQSGQYPATGFYLQTIFFEQGDLNLTAFYNKVIEIADSVNAIMSTGVAQWNTLKQTYTEWENAYNAQMFQWECGQIINSIADVVENNFTVYPNPASEKITFEMNGGEEASIKIFNSMGAIVHQSNINSSRKEIDVRNFSSGIYFYHLTNEEGIFSSGKIIVH